MPSEKSITVISVCRDLGLTPNREMMWSIGAAVRDEYQRRHGSLPPKELRPKTYEDKGSHCFAVYPSEMRPFIESELRKHKAEADRQWSFEWA